MPRTAKRTVRLRGTCLPSLAALRDGGVFGPEASLRSRSGRRRTDAASSGRPGSGVAASGLSPSSASAEIAAPGARRCVLDHQAGVGDAVDDEEQVLRGHVGPDGAARLGPREQLDEPAADAVEELCRSSRAKQLGADRVAEAAVGDLGRRDQLRAAAGTPPRGRRSRARRRPPRRAARRGAASSATSRSSLVGKRRKIVPTPTPARSAIIVDAARRCRAPRTPRAPPRGCARGCAGRRHAARVGRRRSCRRYAAPRRR